MKGLLIGLLCVIVAHQSVGQEENEIEMLGSKREFMNYDVMISPNPARGPVLIKAPKGATCKIVSTKGTYVGTWTLETGELQLTDMPLGTYIVLITFKDKQTHRKLLVL